MFQLILCLFIREQNLYLSRKKIDVRPLQQSPTILGTSGNVIFMNLICTILCIFSPMIFKGVGKGVSKGVRRGSVFCRSPFKTLQLKTYNDHTKQLLVQEMSQCIIMKNMKTVFCFTIIVFY